MKLHLLGDIPCQLLVQENFVRDSWHFTRCISVTTAVPDCSQSGGALLFREEGNRSNLASGVVGYRSERKVQRQRLIHAERVFDLALPPCEGVELGFIRGAGDDA